MSRGHHVAGHMCVDSKSPPRPGQVRLDTGLCTPVCSEGWTRCPGHAPSCVGQGLSAVRSVGWALDVGMASAPRVCRAPVAPGGHQHEAH